MAEEAKSSFLASRLAKAVLGAVVALFVFGVIVFIANYRFPVFFDPPKAPNDVSGWTFATTVIDIGDQMFDNWLPNDLLWPTALMDNRPNFQLGELEMLKYTVFRLKENLSRLRSSDAMDPDCSEAFTLLSNDPLKWLIPSAESRFKMAMESLKRYRANLEEGKARFSPRADNLSELLAYYVSLLGSLNSELAKAPGELRLKRPDQPAPVAPASPASPASPPAPGPDPPTAPAEAPPPAAPAKVEFETARVPYSMVDDNFYQAQGAAYVLRGMMVAIKVDFREILEVKKAAEIVDDIVLTLDQSQFEPLIVLNGDIGSITANHSMELHSILENARQKINNLVEMLSQ
ncbi:MAG: DUF2333 family protein [Deltaproteobacteria bacterium]|jgi:hypothetical protein|nr:DUF2333 family protein [Deltaproteobacteria bacterium]